MSVVGSLSDSIPGVDDNQNLWIKFKEEFYLT
jgi:hypothetical protein